MLLLLLIGCADNPKEYVRRPCPDSTAWDPNLPIFVAKGYEGSELSLNQSEASRLTLTKGGVPVNGIPFGFSTGMGYCVPGGLEPDTDYEWTFAAAGTYVQEHQMMGDGYIGTWAFHTAAVATHRAPADVVECRALLNKSAVTERICEEFRDTGDSGRRR